MFVLLFLALVLLFLSKLPGLLALLLEFPHSVSNPNTTYCKTGGLAQWYMNRLVLGTMVRKPFGSRHDGARIIVFWLDLSFFYLTCLCLMCLVFLYFTCLCLDCLCPIVLHVLHVLYVLHSVAWRLDVFVCAIFLSFCASLVGMT